MDYEKKYKEALRKASKIHRDDEHEMQKYMEVLFPELKEPNDENIRKSLIKHFREYESCTFDGLTSAEVLRWLEKQGEQDNSNVKDYNSIDPHFGKPIDKVEPKFNFSVGQWIVATGKCVYLITKIDGFNVTLVDVDGNEYVFDTSSLEDARLWTINDAKDGDVLATSAGAFIYNGNNGGGSCPGSYCGINTLGRFKTGVETHWTGKKVYPATKEQRNLLFQKMKESGYEWDANKNELKLLITNGGDFFESENCEQNPTWSEEDERNLQGIIDEIRANKNDAPDYDIETYDRFLTWLKSLKQRMI